MCRLAPARVEGIEGRCAHEDGGAVFFDHPAHAFRIERVRMVNPARAGCERGPEGGSEPELWQGEQSRWWTQRMRCLIKERVAVTIAE